MPGSTLHFRSGTPEHSFRYPADYILMPLPRKGGRVSFFFSQDTPNLVCHYNKDHGFKQKGYEWFTDLAETHGFIKHLHTGDWRVYLLAQPRITGFVFNPVSFWLVADCNGGLRVALAEVNNTFGERHCYLCTKEGFAVIQPDDEIQAEKAFHVSPFQPMSGNYRFKFQIISFQVFISIDYQRENGGVYSTLEGNLVPVSVKETLKFFLRRPFGGLGILSLIHWEALKIWLRKAKFFKQPKLPEKEVTCSKNIPTKQ